MMQDKLIPYSTSLKHNMDIEHENWKFGNNPCNFQWTGSGKLVGDIGGEVVTL